MIIPDLAGLAEPIEKLRLMPGNPRRGDVEAIMRDLAEFGQHKNIVAKRDGTVLAGNHTLQAAHRLGWTHVAVAWVDDEDVRAKARSAADNRTGDLGTYDLAEQAAQLVEIQEHDPDLLVATGYSIEDLEELLAELAPEPTGRGGGNGSEAEDELPTAVPPAVQHGDVWALGRHRLMCGSSTAPADVARLLDGTEPVLLLADPPYSSGGFQESGRSSGSIGRRDAGGNARPDLKINNDRLSSRGFVSLVRDSITMANPAMLYIFTDWRMWGYVYDLTEAAGHAVRSMIVWDKGSAGLGRGWRPRHELVLHASAVTVDYDLSAGLGNVLQHNRTGNPDHPTQKPVALVRDLLKPVAMADTVYDPFAGSGTTLLACEHEGRQAFVMEKDAGFCDVICRRFQQLTGEKPINTETGEARDFSG